MRINNIKNEYKKPSYSISFGLNLKEPNKQVFDGVKALGKIFEKPFE